MADKYEAMFNKLAGALRGAGARIAQLEAAMIQMQSRPRSISEEIDAIPGRRIDFVFEGEVAFDITDNRQRGQPVTIQVSQDGPFVMTHYPLVLWRPSAGATATDLGLWRPVSSFPLPDQVIDTNIIDLMYEIQDGGNNRNFQNGPRGPLFSRPDNVVPLPCPTLFAPNATIQFYPTYNNILFNGTVATTAGILHVDLIGYRIVNL